MQLFKNKISAVLFH